MAYAQPVPHSRRSVGFMAVLLLHAFIFWALQNGLATSIVQVIRPPITAEVLDDSETEKEPPPPPKPILNNLPPPQLIMPEIAVDSGPASNHTITVAPPRPAVPKADVAVVTVPPRPNPRRPLTKPDYPPSSHRLGEQGTVEMTLTIDEQGKVTGATIFQSSGYERLDDAAIKHALRSWQLTPGTVGGKATTMQMRFRLTFNLVDP